MDAADPTDTRDQAKAATTSASRNTRLDRPGLALASELVEDRRRWARLFPEGTVEFVAACRILVVIFLVAYLGMEAVFRTGLLFVLGSMLAFEAGMSAFWVLCLSLDALALAGRETLENPRRNRRTLFRLITTTIGATSAGYLSLMATMNLVPGLPRSVGMVLFAILLVVAGVVSVVLMKRAGLLAEKGFLLWAMLMFVPGVHWLAVQRHAARLARRFDAIAVAHLGREPEPRSIAIPIADVLWIVTFLPWGVALAVGLVGLLRGDDSFARAELYGFVCGAMPFILLAIANIAAMEAAQNSYVRLLRPGSDTR